MSRAFTMKTENLERSSDTVSIVEKIFTCMSDDKIYASLSNVITPRKSLEISKRLRIPEPVKINVFVTWCENWWTRLSARGNESRHSNLLAPFSGAKSWGLPYNYQRFLPDDRDEHGIDDRPLFGMYQVVWAFSRVHVILCRDVTQTKVLHTQEPDFRGAKVNFNDFADLCRYFLRSHQNRTKEKNKLQFFEALSTMKRSTYSKAWDVIFQFRKEFSRDDLTKISKSLRSEWFVSGP